MEYREGIAVCWCLQPMGGIPATQIPGRIVGSKPGYVTIRVFDEEGWRWIERPVRPITLRRIGPEQSALLEDQEATCPPRPHAPRTEVPSEGPRPARALTSEERHSLLEITHLRPNVGRARVPDTDLHIRTAYFVLIVGESIGATGRLAGVTPERVRQRVRHGVIAALRQVGDSLREELQDANLWKLRRHAVDLKPALEKAFLALPPVATRKVPVPKQRG